MKLHNYFFALLLPCSMVGYSQTPQEANVVRQSTRLKLAQNGAFVYPGVKVGLEMPVKIVNVIKLKKSGKKKEFSRDLFLTVNTSWYHHSTFHDNVYVTAGLLKRRTNSHGFLSEISTEVGLSRTFLGGTTYKVGEDGAVKINKLTGHYYAAAVIRGGVGYDFEKKVEWPLLVYSSVNLLGMLPYNSTVYVRPMLEIGVVYKPAHFLDRNVKTKRR